METYYTILEIDCNATSQEIKVGYKRLAILRHPDKNLKDSANACIAFQKVYLIRIPVFSSLNSFFIFLIFLKKKIFCRGGREGVLNF